MNFYKPATTQKQMKEVKKNAKHQYRFFKLQLEGVAKDHQSYTMMVGQATIYAGIANVDKEMFQKGIAKFKRGVAKVKKNMEDDNKYEYSCIVGKNDARNKEFRKNDQPMRMVIDNKNKNEMIKNFEEFSARKLLYYERQMPSQYKYYWNGLK